MVAEEIKVLGIEYPFKSNFFELNAKENHQLHYVDEGDKNLPVLLLVHGNPTWSFYYRNVIKHFSKKFRVISLDNLGCGLSSKPQDESLYNLKNHIQNLTVFIEFLNLTSIHLMVHDWGGAIGLGWAVKYPTRVKSLVITNTAAFRSLSIPLRIGILKTPFLGPFVIKYLNGFCKPAVSMACEKKLPKNIADGFLFPYRSVQNRVAINAFVQDIPLHSLHKSYETLSEVESGLASLNCPKLIVWGGKDFCFHDGFFKKWQKIYPQAESLYLEKAGHYLLEDAFFEVSGAMESFFQKNGFIYEYLSSSTQSC